MTDITDYADLLAHAHDTDDLDKVPNRDADKLRAMFLDPKFHDFADLLVIPGDDAKAFEYLRKAITAWGDLMEAAKHPDTMAAAANAYREACSDFAQQFIMLAGSLTRTDAEDALREAYDRLHPEDDGIASEDERARVRDWRATA